MAIAKGSRFQYAGAGVCVLAALFTGCSHDPNVRKQKYLESGQRYFDKGQYREAEIQFENAIQVDSRFADAHYKLALAAMKLGDGRTTRQELESTIQFQPEYVAARVDLANLLILGHNFDEGKGNLADARKELGDAKEQLDWLTEKQSNNPDVYLARASYYAASNDTTAALADTQKALQLDPSRSDSYLSLAFLQMHGQQWDAAEVNFKKAVELSPKSTNASGLSRELLPDSRAISRGGAGVPAGD